MLLEGESWKEGLIDKEKKKDDKQFRKHNQTYEEKEGKRINTNTETSWTTLFSVITSLMVQKKRRDETFVYDIFMHLKKKKIESI